MGYDAARNLLVTCLRQDEAKVLDGLKRIAECMCALAWGYKEAGMDGIYYASLGGERDRWFTAEEFARWIAPLDQLILSEIRKAGCAAVLHICKDHLDMERYRSYNSCCDAVNWGVYEAPYSIEEGRGPVPGQAGDGRPCQPHRPPGGGPGGGPDSRALREALGPDLRPGKLHPGGGLHPVYRDRPQPGAGGGPGPAGDLTYFIDVSCQAAGEENFPAVWPFISRWQS